MSFIAKLTGKSGAGTTPSNASVAPTRTGAEPAVRVKPYTGLEVKTLWNHFNKDDLLTVAEVGDLLERILMKDASDIFGVVRGAKVWKDYCSTAFKIMDTSQGSTIDLQEFNSEFNAFYVSRLYYGVKSLVPSIHAELLKSCELAGLDSKRLAELEDILKGDGTQKKILKEEIKSSVELAEIARLNDLVASLTLQLEAASKASRSSEEMVTLKAELVELESKGGKLSKELTIQKDETSKLLSEKTSLVELNETLKKDLKGLQDQLSKLQASSDLVEKKHTEDALRLKNEIDSLNEQINTSASAKSDIQKVFEAEAAKHATELEALKAKLRSVSSELDEIKANSESQIQSKDSRILSIESELKNLREISLREAQQWKDRFDEVIDENSKCKSLLSEMRAEIIKTNSDILESQLRSASPQNNSNQKLASLPAAALSGSSLDPFRTELVHQFGSLESVMGKRKKLTLHELESIATSIGYTREYSKKLFYALDSRSRGFLTVDQFSRPLPMLNDDLCLLTKDTST